MNVFQYDLCIVGAGMVGSAAARYVSIDSQLHVCLIGPQEPKNRTCLRGDEIFGSHYDNGRSACRTEHIDPFWGNLARASIAGYKSLERMSGYMEFSDDDSALLDEKGGWINPRKLVDAEILIASKQGCDVIRDVVSEITKLENREIGYQILTDQGKMMTTKRVLLATNVFTMHRKLLPPNIVPKFYASPQTVVMGEVKETDVKLLRSFPSMVYHGQGGNRWPKDYPRNRDGNIHFYGSSMVEYPDGKHYVKIGHSDDILNRYLTLDEVSGWYSTGGDPRIVEHLKNLLKSIFTGLEFQSFKIDSCVTMVTATGRPYIDMIAEQFGVVIGGNGHSAMSCDAIGCLAAKMILGNADMNQEKVLARCKIVTEAYDNSKL